MREPNVPNIDEAVDERAVVPAIEKRDSWPFQERHEVPSNGHHGKAAEFRTIGRSASIEAERHSLQDRRRRPVHHHQSPHHCMQPTHTNGQSLPIESIAGSHHHPDRSEWRMRGEHCQKPLQIKRSEDTRNRRSC